jgi:1-acyl-sn-glycerol-3-phosphate acyltransferase
MRYIKLFLVVIWMMISFGLGFLISIFRWGDLNINKFTAGLFGRGGLRILGIRLEKSGFEHCEDHQPCIYLANHQGALDILTFGTVYPRNCVVVAKKEISWVPVLNVFYIGAGNILIDRKKKTSAHASIASAVKRVKQNGASVWLFPEGTRNRHRDQEVMLPLKKGAFHLAIEAQVPIVPLVSGPIAHVVDTKKKVLKPGVVQLKALAPIETRGLTIQDVDALAEKTRALMIEAILSLDGSPS